MTFHTKTFEAAKGKWRGILLSLGVPESALRDKHGPCPVCGGDDRFRFDNKEGAGTFICSHCGAGDGLKLAQLFTGLGFREVASQIDALIGNITPDTVRPKAEITDEERRVALRALWAQTKPVQYGDLADRYLTARGCGDTSYPKALRFGTSIRDGEGGIRPCLAAVVSNAEGHPVTMHRTFLRPDGLAKAEMASPRKLMPGSIPEGAAVRLSDGAASSIGIAEGIETALSASALYGLPVWAAISAGMLAKWCPPPGCEEVAIFGDSDPGFAGQAAAYTLAHRLAVKGIAVTVHVPDTMGYDWNDVLMSRRKIS